MMASLSLSVPLGSVASAASVSTTTRVAAAVSIARDVDATVACRSGRLVFPLPGGAVSQGDDGDNDNGRQNEQQSAQSAPSRVSLHLKVINND